MTSKETEPQLTCRTCHFLVPTGERTIPLDQATRAQLDKNNENLSICCFHGVWRQQSNDAKHVSQVYVTSKIERKDKCFYFPYDEYMNLDVAVKLQEKRAQNEALNASLTNAANSANAAKKSVKWAAVSAIASAFIALLTLITSVVQCSSKEEPETSKPQITQKD